jgi:hypothetical protein
LRKLLLVMVLLAVAFVGGTLAQGSNPGWMRALLRVVAPSGPGIGTLPSSSLTHLPEESLAPGSIPAAPLPPLVIGPVPEEKEQSTAASPSSAPTPLVLGESTPPPLQVSPSSPVLSAPKHSDNADSETPAPLPISSSVPQPIPGRDPLGNLPDRNGLARTREPASIDPSVLGGQPPTPVAAGSANHAVDSRNSPGISPPARTSDWADAPGSAPATAALPRLEQVSEPAPKVDRAIVLAQGKDSIEARAPINDRESRWAEVLRRMRSLGIGRYWIEGEPDGSVLFRCVIPVAGRRAVGQQFEGEGADPVSAAAAALKRVALWKATEAP